MTKSKKPRVSVIEESDTGRNKKFIDNKTGETMTRAKFVKKINNDEYEDYYTRKQEGLNTPVAKPDGKKDNNLGWVSDINWIIYFYTFVTIKDNRVVANINAVRITDMVFNNAFTAIDPNHETGIGLVFFAITENY